MNSPCDGVWVLSPGLYRTLSLGGAQLPSPLLLLQYNVILSHFNIYILSVSIYCS